MTSPENISPRPGAIQFNPEHVDVTTGMAQEGIASPPTYPEPVNDAGGVLAQPADPITTMVPGKVIVVPADESTAKAWSKGTDSDARTWLGIIIIRTIQKAIRSGLQAVVGTNK